MEAKSIYYVLAIKHEDGIVLYKSMVPLESDKPLTYNMYATTWYDESYSAGKELHELQLMISQYEKSHDTDIQQLQKEIAHCTEYLATHQARDDDEDDHTILRTPGTLTRFRNRLQTANENLECIQNNIGQVKATAEQLDGLAVYELIVSYRSDGTTATTSICVGNKVEK